MSQITTHILDTSIGKPAAGIGAALSFYANDEWKETVRGVANTDGRITGLATANGHLEFGVYRLRFETGQYFKAKGVVTFYPYVDIIFEIQSAEHYHVPLLLNPFGYSTYRGS